MILANLLQDKEYFRAVSPYIKKEYFEDRVTSVLYELIDSFAAEYKKPPGKEVLEVQIENYKGLTEKEFKEVSTLLEEITRDHTQSDPKWLLDETEKYCREKAIYNAIMDSVSIIDGSDTKRSEGVIPQLLSDALAVSFDKNVGHDYFSSIEARWDFYTQKETKFPSLLKMLDKVMHGGVSRKTLNLIMAVSGGGKSAAMCSLAANYISQGYNVLYITMELAEERVAERIDANLLNIPINQVKDIPKDLYCKKLNKIKEKSFGRLFLKEYPTGCASVNNFRALLDELLIKKDFKPDIVFVDYLGICASAHYKSGGSANSYTVQKSVAEELRGLAVERDLVVWSAVQSNRSGYGNSDMNETSMAESIGILMTADFVLGLIRNADLDELGQVMMKQIKSRYGDVSYFNRFICGFDRARMKLFDIDDQSGIVNENAESDHMNKIADSKELRSEPKKKPGLDKSSEWSFDE
jgi:replicative DNA helicase